MKQNLQVKKIDAKTLQIEIESFCRKGKEFVKKNHLNPTRIFTMARGGFIPALYFSHLFGIKHIDVFHFDRIKSPNPEKRVKIIKPYPLRVKSNDTILVVDSIIEKGDTVWKVKKYLDNDIKEYGLCNVRYFFGSIFVLQPNIDCDFCAVKTFLIPSAERQSNKTWLQMPYETKPEDEKL